MSSGLTRVTFLTPHQREGSGGVHVIEQLARRLAPAMEVHLVVLDGATRPVPGVHVIAASRSLTRTLPSSDMLLFPADSPAGEDIVRLPDRTGRRALLIQSYHHPNGASTRWNLDRVDAGVAVSSWLVDQAAMHGCRAALVRPGLDRRVFFSPRRDDDRQPVVAVLDHHETAKGSADALAALAVVRQRVPGMEVHLFGRGDSRHPVIDRHHGMLTRGAVGALLRRTAVFVCASWEEGLGLPAVEALACGAALATTDTGGGRDYAIDGHTALVSPPRETAALARNIADLLVDPELRRRFARAGHALVTEKYRSWSYAGRRLRRVLVTL